MKNIKICAKKLSYDFKFINISFKLEYYVKTRNNNFSNFYSQRCVMYFALTQHQQSRVEKIICKPQKSSAYTICIHNYIILCITKASVISWSIIIIIIIIFCNVQWWEVKRTNVCRASVGGNFTVFRTPMLFIFYLTCIILLCSHGVISLNKISNTLSYFHLEISQEINTWNYIFFIIICVLNWKEKKKSGSDQRILRWCSWIAYLGRRVINILFLSKTIRNNIPNRLCSMVT